jgi:hypothetical protein
MSGEVWGLIPEIFFNNLIGIGDVEVISNITRQRANGDVGDTLLVEASIDYTFQFDVVA